MNGPCEALTCEPHYRGLAWIEVETADHDVREKWFTGLCELEIVSMGE